MMQQFRSFFSILGITLAVACFPLASAAAEDLQELLDFLKTEAAPPAPLLSADVTIVDDFVPGEGVPVGEAQLVQGKVFVIHRGIKIAYRLKKGLPVFGGDTLITESRSRASLLMADRSALALAGRSKLVIDRSIYDAKANSRDTELRLLFGRVRSIVSKIGSKPNYRIVTPVAVAGVRGTDFGLAVGLAPSKKTSALQRIPAFLSPVREAHAMAPGALQTVALTGPGSTIGLAGAIGATTIVGPTSVASVVDGAAASAATFVGVGPANEALDTIGPGLATMSMPPELD